MRSIANLVFELHAEADDVLFADHGPFTASGKPNRPSDVILQVARGPMDPPPGRLVFTAGPSWQLHDDQGLFHFSFWAAQHGGRPFKTARVSRDFSTGRIILNSELFAPGVPTDPLTYPLDEVLTVHLLGRGMGVEFHACGVIDEDGLGLLFAGQSGAGKTTTARLYQRYSHAQILSDDRVIVRRENDRFFIHGTPWHGEADLALNSSAPLRAILLPEAGGRNELLRLDGADAVARLVARSFLPFHDRSSIERTSQIVSQLVSSVPCYRFPFVPDQSAVAFLRERLG
jgi:hypothetical protein